MCFHVDLLEFLMFTQKLTDQHSLSPRAPELIDGEEEYEVEDIITHRINRRKKAIPSQVGGIPIIREQLGQ